MIHPLLKLAVKEPHLIADHLSAYVGLAGEEVSKLTSSLAMRAGLYAGAGVLAVIGLVLVGVALLLVAATPSVDHATWALIVVPLTPFLLSGIMAWMAQARPVEKAFDTLKGQVAADMALIREVGAS